VCSLADVQQEVFVTPGTSAFNAYGKNQATEQFTCNHGLNEGYRNDIIRDNLGVVGKDSEGNARIIELSFHPFFMATLFLPQLSSKPGNPHPIILAFLEAAVAFQTLRGTKN
jgi:CTP synthase (UTP-ammonia lyase)